MRPLALAGLLLVAACSAPQPPLVQRIYVPQAIPASLLTCAAWPSPPEPPRDVRGLVQWLAEGKAAWVDCSYKLGQVRGLVEPAP